MTIHQRHPGFLGFAACVLVVVAAASGLAPAEKPELLSVLRPGLPVTMMVTAGKYELGIVEGIDGPLSHEIAEVGDDFVVVADLIGLKRTRIPIWSLSSITTTTIRP